MADREIEEQLDELAGIRPGGEGAFMPIAADPERDRRREAYRERERRRAARALDRYIETMCSHPKAFDSRTDVIGERLVEAVGDYVLARLSGRPGDEVALAGPLKQLASDVESRSHHNRHYGATERLGQCPECGSYRTDGLPPILHKPKCTHNIQKSHHGVPDPTGAYADMCSQLPSCRDGEHSESCEVSIYRAAQHKSDSDE